IPERAEHRHGVAGIAGGAGQGAGTAVRVLDCQGAGADRAGRSEWQAECAVSGVAQSGSGRAAGKSYRAVGGRAAAALLPHERRRSCRIAAMGRRLECHPRLGRVRTGRYQLMNTDTHTRTLPTTIVEYLQQLREALADADPALIHDALYDAEAYLRSELAEHTGKSEAEAIAGVAGSYGAPEEGADIYRETEVTVNRALRSSGPVLRPPVVIAAATAAAAAAPEATVAAAPVAPARSWWARFFGVALDPH